MTKPRDGRFVWVTWLSGIMSGERSCVWGPWFRTNYTDYAKVPSDFNEAQWMLDHTRLLTDLVGEREKLGEQVQIQGQNRFRYEHPPGLVVAGMPDLVGIAGRRATVYDAKTGQPHPSHQIQVMLYMYFLPQCMAAYRGMQLEGCVVYGDHRLPIPASAINNAFAENVFRFLDMLDADAPARRVSSEMECGFCDITSADCPERMEVSLTGLLGDEP